MKIIYIIILVGILSFGCNSRILKVDIDKVVNGGIKLDSLAFDDENIFLNKLQPGTTCVFWKDAVLKLEFGPNYANSATTKISNEFITEVTFINLNAENQFAKLDFSSNNFILTSQTSIDELIQFLEDNNLELEYDLLSLINIYKNFSKESNLTVGSFLEFLLNNGVVSQTEYNRLIELISNFNITSNSSLEELISKVQNNSLRLLISGSNFIKFITLHELGSQLDINSLILQLSSMGINFDLSFEELQNFILQLGLSSNLNMNLLKNEIEVSKPNIKLEKDVDQKIAWYGATLIYTINFENDGDLSATEIRIIDQLPWGTKFSSIDNCTHSYSFEVKEHGNMDVVTIILKGIVSPHEKGVIKLKVNILENMLEK